jgi:hypothetical protein
VNGLDSPGPTTHLTKPFSFAELLARLHALARRGVQATCRSGRIAPASTRRHGGRRRGETEIELSAKEFALLQTLHRRAVTSRRGSTCSSTPGTTATTTAPRRAWMSTSATCGEDRRPRLGAIETVRGGLSATGRRRRVNVVSRSRRYPSVSPALAFAVCDGRRARATGLFLYVRLGDSRSDDRPEPASAPPTSSALAEKTVRGCGARREHHQILDRGGSVVDSTRARPRSSPR